MMDDHELEEFKAWKRAKNKSELEESFFSLEQALTNPSGRQFNCVMPSQAFRILGNAIMALKKELVK